MEHRTDESGLQLPGRDAVAPSAEHTPGPAAEIAVPSAEIPVPSAEIPVASAEIPVASAEIPVPSAEIPAHEPPSKDGPAAVSINAGEGQAEQRLVTGEPRVDAALARLAELPELPVTEHRAVFEHIHRSLSEVLGELDAGLPPGGRDARGGRDVADAEGADGMGDRAENARGARQDQQGARSGASRSG